MHFKGYVFCHLFLIFVIIKLIYCIHFGVSLKMYYAVCSKLLEEGLK